MLETHLGFLIQGRYRMTPSRDNVSSRDEWNRKCIQETGLLLVESLHWLRDKGFLNADALSCLPINLTQFKETMFLICFMWQKMPC